MHSYYRQCPHCNEKFENCLYNDHISKCREKNFSRQCPKCKMAINIPDYVNHVTLCYATLGATAVHREEPEGFFQCTVCDDKFANKRSVEVHFSLAHTHLISTTTKELIERCRC